MNSRRRNAKLLDSRVEARISKRTPVAYLVGQAWFGGIALYRRCTRSYSTFTARRVYRRGVRAFRGYASIAYSRPLLWRGLHWAIRPLINFPKRRLILADLSDDALALAQENVALHNAAARVTTLQSDLFAALDGCL